MELRDLVATPDDVLLARIYQTLLRDAFEDNEVQPIHDARARLISGTGVRAVVAVDEAGEPVCALFADWHPGSRTLLLGNLATRVDLRGQGLGAELVRRVVPSWVAQLSPALGVAEAEDPRLLAGDRRDLAHRRVRFYEAFGARIAATPFVQPPLADDLVPATNLLLMVFAVDGQPLPDRPVDHIPASSLRGFVADYFDTYLTHDKSRDPLYLDLDRRIAEAGPWIPLLAPGGLAADAVATFSGERVQGAVS